jgi:hypothetical protein
MHTRSFGLGRPILLLPVLFVLLGMDRAEAQDLRLEISVPKTTIKASEPVNLTVRVINLSSSNSYYVSGDMGLGESVMGNFGMYHLQFRKRGVATFVNTQEYALDSLPAKNAPTPSPSDIIVSSRLVLLEGNPYNHQFVGSTFISNWKGLTLQEPGRYSIRVTYSSAGIDQGVAPKGIRYPIFLQPLTSNVLDLEIMP